MESKELNNPILTTRVAKLGEKTLDAWASQVDITINPSIEDTTGWDYVLEFPLEIESAIKAGTPLDKLPPALQCWMQVKSSNSRPGFHDVKLSNWKRLIDTPLPAFFFVCEFDNKSDCQTAYLVHIGDHYIREALKRLRLAGLEKEAKLNKRTMRFIYGETDQISELSGIGLIDAVQRHVLGDLDYYSSWKKELRNSAGYEKGRFLAQTIMLIPEEYTKDPVEYLVDFSIGKVPRIDTQSVVFKDVRFGIEAPEAAQTFIGGFLSLKDRKPVDTILFRLSSDDGEREIRLEMDVYVPQGFLHSPGEEYFKTLYEAPFISVESVYKPVAEGIVNIRLPDPNEIVKLEELYPACELIQLFDYALNTGCNLRFDVRSGEDSLGPGTIPLDPSKDQLDELSITIAELTQHAWIVSKYFDIQNEVEITIDYLLGLSVPLSVLTPLLSKTPLGFKILIDTSVELEPSVDEKCIPIVMSIELGWFRIIASYAVLAKISNAILPVDASKPIELATNDVRLNRTRLLDFDQDAQKSMQEMFNSLKSAYQDSAEILIIEGINAHLVVD